MDFYINRSMRNTKNQNKQTTNSRAVKSKIGRRRILASFLFVLLTTLGVLLAASCCWALNQFADLNMEEIVFELTAPLEGTGNGMVGKFIINCVLPAGFTLVGTMILSLAFIRSHPFRLVLAIGGLVGAGSMLASAAVFWRAAGLGTYLKNLHSNSDYIEQHYADPAHVTLEFPEKKRNLIRIYLESIENSFTDYEHGGASKDNFIPELTQVAQENEDFSGNDPKLNGGYSMPGTTWTIGGIFASTAGLPLKTSVDDNDMSSQQSFFPTITAMGDILEEQGYRQVFACGSDATFGGRRLYLTEHGDFEFLDTVYAKANGLIPPDYSVFWGFEDEKLIQLTKDRLTELGSSDQPFNYTMLTVDTHAPNGYTCGLDGDQFDFPYGNAVACSTRQVYDLLEWIKQQPFYDNTTIVITGDHPTMATSMANRLDKGYNRKTYTTIINSAAQVENPDLKRDYTTFDLFPTTLAALGVKFQGDRLGLGTNLYSGTKTLSEEGGFDAESAEIAKTSTFMTKLEKPSRMTIELKKKYKDAVIQYGINRTTHALTFISPDTSDDSGVISGVNVRIWHYANQQYIHTVIGGRSWGDDGIYSVQFIDRDNSYFSTHELHFQLLMVTPEGSIDLGPEMVVDPQKDSSFLLDPDSPIAQYALGKEQGERTLLKKMEEDRKVTKHILPQYRQ